MRMISSEDALQALLSLRQWRRISIKDIKGAPEYTFRIAYVRLLCSKTQLLKVLLRMVKQRQIAQREKEKGNKEYKNGQFGEAYRCYSCGLDAEKHNMELQANAALASLKMGSHLQAIEHCDKVNTMARILF